MVSTVDGVLVRNPAQVVIGETLDVRVAVGRIGVTVTDSDSGRRAKGGGRRKK